MNSETAGDYPRGGWRPQVHRDFMDFSIDRRIVPQILGKFASGSYAKRLDLAESDQENALGIRKIPNAV